LTWPAVDFVAVIESPGGKVMMETFSQELSGLVRGWTARMVHIGGPNIAGRTGIVVSEGLVASLAREAVDGEPVTVLSADFQEVAATVQAWDKRTGLVLLRAEGLGASLGGPEPAGEPELGQLALTVAYPSPQGIEASLALVRFVGGDTSWGGVAVNKHFQTDGLSFPGFGGSAVLDPAGGLLGVVTQNSEGNEGWVLPAREWLRLVNNLKESGSWRRPWIGVSLLPVRLDAVQEKLAGQSTALILNAVVENGPAFRAGLRPGDLLLAVDGVLVDGGRLPPVTSGVASSFRLLRGDQLMELPLTPAGQGD
jgi:S1-C subfamily serine protease